MTIHNHRLLGGTAPRALVGAVRAEGPSIAELLGQINASVSSQKEEQKSAYATLTKTFEDFKAANDQALADIKAGKTDVVTNEKVDRINADITAAAEKVSAATASIKAFEKDIDELSKKIAAMQTGAGTAAKADPRMANAHAAEYCEKFSAYFRNGERALDGGERALRDLGVKAAMMSSSDTDGGFTVRPEMETAIDETLKEVSPMRQICTIRPISATSYKKLVNQHGTASGWVGEGDSRPQTAGANLSEIEFPAMELYAMPAASQTLLDDSFVDIGSWLASEVELEFAAQEGSAFVAGDGVKKPRGFIGGYTPVADASYAWGKVGYVATGGAGDWAATDKANALIDLYTAPKTAYQQNGTFVMNRKTLGAVRKLKDGQGNYLVNVSFRADGAVMEVLGRPVVEMPDMPDIAANSYSIAFGDFRRGYLIVDRVGVRVLRDPYTAKPYVLFYTTKRVGGGIQNFEAIKLLKFAAN
ncbi:phage major capsid protein [Azorhizobium doebereinerae]|uniref:phage major capsid protein n=1 Tax=Azorhizobium doebereinerae TaxID=281091 RepID=UPI00040FA806|nr:phage major capsid protein [Azorhizobium doebereinerae]